MASGLFARWKQFTTRLVLAISRVLLAAGLFFAYWVGVAITRLLAEVVARRMLGRGSRSAASFWEPARGYGTTLDDVQDQS